MPGLLRKRFESPDDTFDFPNGRYDVLKLEGVEVGRLVAEPGWRYVASLGERCPSHHVAWYMLSGHMGVEMEDGTVAEFGPGDIGVIPPGHDAWVIGEEPVVGLDILPSGLGAGGTPDREVNP